MATGVGPGTGNSQAMVLPFPASPLLRGHPFGVGNSRGGAEERRPERGASREQITNAGTVDVLEDRSGEIRIPSFSASPLLRGYPEPILHVASVAPSL